MVAVVGRIKNNRVIQVDRVEHLAKQRICLFHQIKVVAAVEPPLFWREAGRDLALVAVDILLLLGGLTDEVGKTTTGRLMDAAAATSASPPALR